MLSLKNKNDWLGKTQMMLVAAMLLAGGGFYAFAYRPMAGKLLALNDKMDAQRRELLECRNKTVALTSVKADVQRLRGKLQEYKIPPAQLGLTQFYQEIGTLQKGASLKNLNTHWDGAPVRLDRLTEIPVVLNFDGDFVNVCSFLKQAEDLRWLTRVPKMKITTKGNDGQVKVVMTMNLYTSAAE